MTRYFPIAAIVLSLTALGFVAVSGDNSNDPQQENVELKQRLQALEEKDTALEASLEHSRAQGPNRDPTVANLDSPTVENLKRQVTKLTQKQEELDDFAKGLDNYGIIKATEKEIAAAYLKVTDEKLDAWTRTKNVATLKRYDQFDQAAVDSMRKLWNESSDHNEKAAALVALRGHVTPAIRDEIFETLNAEIEGGNKSGRLRYHAIEALEPLLPDPAVEEWLTHLAQNDPEPKIAGRAGRPIGLQVDQAEGRQ